MRKAEIQTGLGLPRVTKWIIVARTGFEPKAVFLTTPYKWQKGICLQIYHSQNFKIHLITH